jgi:hypothetical protein
MTQYAFSRSTIILLFQKKQKPFGRENNIGNNMPHYHINSGCDYNSCLENIQQREQIEKLMHIITQSPSVALVKDNVFCML